MEKPLVPQPERESMAKHRRQFYMQILLPVLAVTLLGVLSAILIGIATFRDNGDVTRWGQVATIWLSIPVMIGLLIALVVSAGSVYGMRKLLKITPIYTGLVQSYALYYNAKIVIWTNMLIDPVLKIKAWIEMLTNFLSRSKEKSEEK